MKSVVVHVGLDSGQDARFRVAVDIVQAFDGHLTCVQPATPIDAYMPVDPFGGAAFIGDSFATARKAEDDLRVSVEEKLGKEGVAWDWHCHAASAARVLVSHSWLSDLIVVSGPPTNWAARLGMPPIAAEVVTRAPVPTLVVPDEAQGFAVDGPAVVAWNGSPESCQAVRAALPLLKRARSVSLVCVEVAQRDRLPPLHAAEFLSRHGVPSEVVPLEPRGRPVADVLCDAAEDRHAAYLVMGAYGHSRWQESLLGGVTRDMLIGNPLPLLLAH